MVPTIVTAGGFSNTTGTCLVVVSAQGVVPITYTAGNSAGASTTTVLQVPDPTGPPITLKCTAAGTGALGSATFAISGAAPGPIDPRVLITTVKISVNGQNLRDISPTQIQAIAAARGYVSDFGTLSLFFTEPWQNFLRDNAMLLGLVRPEHVLHPARYCLDGDPEAAASTARSCLTATETPARPARPTSQTVSLSPTAAG